MKYLKYLLITLILFISSISICNVSAITINDYLKDLEKLQQEKKNQQIAQEKTEEEIRQAEKEMQEINDKIVKATDDIETAEKEIKDLEQEINKKEEQIKDLVSFLQISDSENFYLKYIFGAENFTDLIYRISVIEQLTTKSDELIDEMNTLIKSNEKKIEDLEKKKIELNELNKQILKKLMN